MLLYVVYYTCGLPFCSYHYPIAIIVLPAINVSYMTVNGDMKSTSGTFQTSDRHCGIIKLGKAKV